MLSVDFPIAAANSKISWYYVLDVDGIRESSSDLFEDEGVCLA